jgi:hypothetical protein
MTAFSNYLENALLNATLRNTSFTSPSSVFISLYTTNPDEDDSGTEVAASGYDRFEVSAGVSFTTASGGSCRNTEAWTFLTATTAWGSVSHFGIHDATTGGNLLYYAALSSTITIGTSDIVRFTAGSLTVKLD